MTWRSSNLWYALILAPLLEANAVLSYLLLAPSWWAYVPSIIVFYLFYRGARRLVALPHPKAAYGEMQSIHLPLPRDYGVDVRTCPAMDKYEFIPRIAELLSPWRFPEGEKPVVAISPGVLAEHGETFMAIAITREVERYQRRFHVKTILHLTAPLLALSAVVMSLFLFGGDWLGAIGMHFAAPISTAVLLAGHFLLWNKTLSRRDREIDSVLAELFSPEEIREFISISERLERKNENEKHRALNEHYARDRLNRLE